MITKTQQKQIDYLRSREPYETLTRQPVYWVSCKECDEGKEFKSADGARTFILIHKGHTTWVQTGKDERA